MSCRYKAGWSFVRPVTFERIPMRVLQLPAGTDHRELGEMWGLAAELIVIVTRRVKTSDQPRKHRQSLMISCTFSAGLWFGDSVSPPRNGVRMTVRSGRNTELMRSLVRFHVPDLEDIDWNLKMSDSLVMDETCKDLLFSVVRSQAESKHTFDDFVRGKGMYNLFGKTPG
jgi:hypothetical protein